jgi:membrane-associated phospholipid phosphatase
LLMTHYVKERVHRPRFQDVLVNPKPEGFSFPSGAALAAAAVYGSVGLLCGRRLRGAAQVAVLSAAFLLPFVIGVSRLFVLNHYLSDVFAGWGAGAGLALLSRGLDGWLDPDAGREPAGAPLAENTTPDHSPMPEQGGAGLSPTGDQPARSTGTSVSPRRP